jgi:hypothetical protein
METLQALVVLVSHSYKRWLGIIELSGLALWRSRSAPGARLRDQSADYGCAHIRQHVLCGDPLPYGSIHLIAQLWWLLMVYLGRTSLNSPNGFRKLSEP